MRGFSCSLTLAVTMAALALFGAGGEHPLALARARARARAESTHATLRTYRAPDARVTSSQRGRSGGALHNGGRKSSRSALLRLQHVLAIAPSATQLAPPGLAGCDAQRGVMRIFDTASHGKCFARAPPV